VKPLTLAFIVVAIFLLIYAVQFTSFALLTFYLLWGITRALTKKVFKIKPKAA
jgi:tryptophan-rich sensory protein